MNIREKILKDMDEYFEQWGTMHYIQIGAHVKEIIDKHLKEIK